MLLVGNGSVVTRHGALPFLDDGAVAIDGGLIVDVGPTAEIRSRYEGSFLDAEGGLIHPGLINGHMHFYSTFARGFGGKGGSARTFTELLQRLWWRLDKALTLEDCHYSALYAVVEAIRCGCTTLIDHHASPHAVRGSLFEVARAVVDGGLSACLCYEVSDRDGPAVAAEGIAENRAFIDHVSRSGDSRLAATFGLHASMTLDDATLERCAEAGEGAGFHVHVAEGPEDEWLCRERHGLSVVERFRRFGLLGPRSLAVHCIHVDDDEKALLAQTQTAVAHNAESNMGNAVGLAPVLDLMRRGVLVGLGTDGYVSDMFRALAVTGALQRHGLADPDAGWTEVPRMLFENNVSLADRYFALPRGRLAPGCVGDVIVIDYRPPTDLSASNVDGHLLFGPGSACVTSVVASGRIVMKDRRLTGLDEERIAARCRELARAVHDRF